MSTLRTERLILLAGLFIGSHGASLFAEPLARTLTSAQAPVTSVPAILSPVAVPEVCEPNLQIGDTTTHYDSDAQLDTSEETAPEEMERTYLKGYFGVFHTDGTPRHYIFGIIYEMSDGTIDIEVLGRQMAGDGEIVLASYKNFGTTGKWANFESTPLLVKGKDNVETLKTRANTAKNKGINMLQRFGLTLVVPFTAGASKPCLVVASDIYDAVKDLGK